MARKAWRTRARKDELALQRQESGQEFRMKRLDVTEQSTALDTGRSIRANLVILRPQQNWISEKAHQRTLPFLRVHGKTGH